MRTTLVLSYWNLNRCVSGGVRRIHGLLSALGSSVLLCQPGEPHPLYRTVPYSMNFGRRKVGINWGMFNFLWPANARLVRRLIREEKPVLVVLTSTWNYFPLTACAEIPMVLDAHDVNAVAVGERLGHGHPFTRMVKGWEARTVRRMNRVFACSSIDRDMFMSLYGLPADRVSVVPNGVSVADFDAVTPPWNLDGALEERLRGATVLFFMGELSYQPNRAALSFLDGVVLPELERREPGGFRLLVCGGPVPSGRFHPSMVFAGQLPDDALRRCMKRADICLAPIMTGSGTRLKVLEYMAARKPVVTTAKGAEGIACESGRDIVVSSPEQFCDDIMALASDRAKVSRIGEAGYSLVKAKYDWDAAIKPLWRNTLSRWIDLQKEG